MTAVGPAIAFLAVHVTRSDFAIREIGVGRIVARADCRAKPRAGDAAPVDILTMAAMLTVVLHRAAQQASGPARWKTSANSAA
jgi:hypothetical protein